MSMLAEFQAKRAAVAALLSREQLDALLLRRASSFAWATCGSNSQVSSASSYGEAALLFLPNGLHLVTNNLEASRLEEEEGLRDLGWEFHVSPWYEPNDTVERLTARLRLGSDGCYPGARDISAVMARVRSCLTLEEQGRFQVLGRLCARAVTSTAATVAPGQTEMEIGARLEYEAKLLGVHAVTTIVAVDERVARYRHAIPGPTRLDRYLMMMLNGRRWGLVCTVTRFIHFGAVPDELQRAHQVTGRIFDDCLRATQPGLLLSDAFALAQAGYARAGVPDAWRDHHQGGATGYEPREFLVRPGMSETSVLGQAFVWNPSLGGARSVDTFIIGDGSNQIVTVDEAWPVAMYDYDGRQVQRPAVMVVE